MSNLNDDDNIDEQQDFEVGHHSSSSSPQIPSFLDNSDPRRLLSHPHFIQRICKYINVRNDFSRAYAFSHINRGWDETMWHYETFQTTFMSQQIFKNPSPVDMGYPPEVYSVSVRAFLVAIGEIDDSKQEREHERKNDSSTSDILMCEGHQSRRLPTSGNFAPWNTCLFGSCTQICLINDLRSRSQENTFLKEALEHIFKVLPFLFYREDREDLAKMDLIQRFTPNFMHQFRYHFRGLVPTALERMRSGLTTPKTSSILHIFRYFENSHYFELYFGKENRDGDSVKQYDDNNSNYNGEIMKDGEGKLERLLFQGIIPLFYKRGVANALYTISDNKYCFLGRNFYTVVSTGQRSMLHRLLVDFIHNSSPTNFFAHDVVNDDGDTIVNANKILNSANQHHELFINPTRKRKEQLQQLIDAEFETCFRPVIGNVKPGGNRGNNKNNRALNLFGDAVVGNNLFALKALLEGKTRASRKDENKTQSNNDESEIIMTSANITFLTKDFDMSVTGYAKFFDSLECKYPNDDGTYDAETNNTKGKNTNTERQPNKLNDPGFDSRINHAVRLRDDWRSRLLSHSDIRSLLELAALCGNIDVFEYLWNNFFKSAWNAENTLLAESSRYPAFSLIIINLSVMIGVCPENHDDYLFPHFPLNGTKFLWFTHAKQEARLKIFGIMLNFLSSQYEAACRIEDEIERKKKVEEQEAEQLRKKSNRNDDDDTQQQQQQQQQRPIVFSPLPTFAPLSQVAFVSLKKHIENTLSLALASISLLHPTLDLVSATRSETVAVHPPTSLMKRAVRLYKIFTANVPAEVMQSILSDRLIAAAVRYSTDKVHPSVDLAWVSPHVTRSFLEYSHSGHFLLRLLQRPTDYGVVDMRSVASEIHHILEQYLFSPSSPSSQHWLTNLVENLERFPGHSPLHHLVESFDHALEPSTSDAMLTVFQQLLHRGADPFKYHPLVLPESSYVDRTHPLDTAIRRTPGWPATERPWWYLSREKKKLQFHSSTNIVINILHRLCQPAMAFMYQQENVELHRRRFKLFGDATRALLRHVQMEFGRETLDSYLAALSISSLGVNDGSALHLACRSAFWNGVDVMVNEFGADVRIKNQAGKIPLYFTSLHVGTRDVGEHEGIENIRDLMKELLDQQEFDKNDALNTMNPVSMDNEERNLEMPMKIRV